MRDIRISKYNIYTLFSILALKSILEIGYVKFVNKYFEYSGFYIEINTIKYAESTLLTLLLCMLLISLEKWNRPSKLVIYILFINLYLPISILYWLMDQSRNFFFLVFFFFIFLVIFTNKFKLITLPQITESKRFIFNLLVAISFSVYSYLIITGGLSRINFNLIDVYETRSGYVANNI